VCGVISVVTGTFVPQAQNVTSPRKVNASSSEVCYAYYLQESQSLIWIEIANMHGVKPDTANMVI